MVLRWAEHLAFLLQLVTGGATVTFKIHAWDSKQESHCSSPNTSGITEWPLAC